MALKVNPNPVSQDSLNRIQPGSINPSQVNPLQVPSSNQPAAKSVPQAPNLSGFGKYQSGGMRIGGVVGRQTSHVSGLNRITNASSVLLPVGETFARVAEGLSSGGEGPLTRGDFLLLNGALGVIQEA